MDELADKLAEHAATVNATSVEKPIPYVLGLLFHARLQFDLVGTCGTAGCVSAACDPCVNVRENLNAFYKQPYSSEFMERPRVFSKYYPNLPDVISYALVLAGYSRLMRHIGLVCNPEDDSVFAIAPNWAQWRDEMRPARDIAGRMIDSQVDAQQHRLETTTSRDELLFEMEKVVEFRVRIMREVSAAYTLAEVNVFRAQSKLTGGKFDRAAPEIRDLVEKELREVTLTAEKQAAIIAKVVMIGRGDPLERIRLVSDTAEAFESVHGSAVALQRSMNAEHARLAAKWDADRAAEREAAAMLEEKLVL